MKKVLLATTMLVAGASVAAAEVTVTGDARMGVTNGYVFGAGADKTTFTSRARVSFGLSGESDSGLSFGASFRADNAGAAAGGTAGAVFISGAFGKLSMGDVDGAANAAVKQVDGVGLTGLGKPNVGDANEMLYIANGGLGAAAINEVVPGFIGYPAFFVVAPFTADPSVLYEFTTGALSVYASATLPNYTGTATDPSTFPATVVDRYSGSAYSVGAAYTMDAYRFSLGYERTNIDVLTVPAVSIDADHIVAGVDGTFGAVTVKARYGRGGVDATALGVTAGVADIKQAALSATYKQDALGVTGFWRTFNTTTPTGANLNDVTSYGLGVSYDLGGGATVKGGIASRKEQVGLAAAQSDTAFDLGVAFSF